MYRDAIRQLLEWKNSKNRKPLVLRGARQVGKTWLLNRFGVEYYENVVYVNMEDESDASSIFKLDLDPHRIIRTLESVRQTKILPEKTLLIFDEVQSVPRALTSLKYFCENAPEYHVAVAGSLLGIALHEGTSFPVGKVDFLDILPMSFYEFLKALGKDGYAEAVRLAGVRPEETSAFHEGLMDMLKKYMAIGGMPEAVKTYVDGGTLSEVRAVQTKIVDAYELDFSKHAPGSDAPKIREIYNAVPQFLSKENKKFVFSAIKESARAREYDAAILWLEDTGLTTRVARVNSTEIPLSVYANRHVFKLFYSDIGLLGAKINLEPNAIVNTEGLSGTFSGAFAEQLVLQEMHAALRNEVYYYSRDDSRGEIDFMIQNDTSVVPIEVKAGENLGAAALKNFLQKWKLKKAIKFSSLPYCENEQIINAPLYLAGAVRALTK